MIRKEILEFIRKYYDAGHIIELNADVMANKLADIVENRFKVSIKEVYTHINLVRMQMEIRSIEIEPRGIFICVEAPIRHQITNEQLADAINASHSLMMKTSPENKLYLPICKHHVELLQIQADRASGK